MKWSYRGGGFDLSKKAIVMGILNITPDSFSDGGLYTSVEDAVKAALQMVKDGAQIIDIGGESTRPGSPEVKLEEELERTIPVIEALRKKWDGAISIDTSKPEVAREALEAGANIVNDVTGLKDPEMVLVCRDSGAGVIVMHMQGNPRTMQAQPSYDNVVSEIQSFFRSQLEVLTIAGIRPESICFDPGIGFGKTVAHNLELIEGLPALEVEGRPLVVGLSRKSFIGKILESDSLEDREWPTVTLTAKCRRLGAKVHRVHQVRDNVDALRMAEAILDAEG